VVSPAIVLGQLERPQTERPRDVPDGGIARDRGPRPGQPLETDRREGNVCSGCIAPTRTPVRRASNGSNTSSPIETGEMETSAPGSIAGSAASSTCESSGPVVATITSSAPRATSDTSMVRPT